MPNSNIIGIPISIDSEDGGFAGECFYQVWDETLRQRVTVTKNNHQQYNIEEETLAYQHNKPVYWIIGHLVQHNGQTLELNTEPHPQNQLKVFTTQGNLPLTTIFSLQKGAHYRNITLMP
ncbi:MAG: hypothetical protein RAM36_05685 [Arsenophonus sp.]|nr:hypothetical protein [Arsenophonus sp.]